MASSTLAASLEPYDVHFCMHLNREKEKELSSSKLKHRPMWIKAEGGWGGEAYLKKWVVKMVGEVIELGCGDGCGQKGGWSTGRWRCRLQSVPPLDSGEKLGGS